MTEPANVIRAAVREARIEVLEKEREVVIERVYVFQTQLRAIRIELSRLRRERPAPWQPATPDGVIEIDLTNPEAT